MLKPRNSIELHQQQLKLFQVGVEENNLLSKIEIISGQNETSSKYARAKVFKMAGLTKDV